MVPDFEKRLNDKMSDDALKELMPEFDWEHEWQQLAQQLPAKRRLLIPVWARAAAILVLLCGAGLAWHLSGGNTKEVATKNNMATPDKAAPATGPTGTNSAGKALAADTLPRPKPAVAMVKRPLAQHKANNGNARYAANGIIYNGTPCPIELRISQMMSCPDNKPKAISSSSTLEPDQSARLNYKESKTIARNCSLTIKEIEIKSIATGEVILLNSSSTPSTAQEVFSYMTREKNGDVLAGMFNYDCEKRNRKHDLRLNNRDGSLILE